MEAVAVPIVMIGPLAETVTIKRAAEALGLTEKAIRRKIEQGIWLQGRHYHRGPDNHLYIDIPGVQRWVRQGT